MAPMCRFWLGLPLDALRLIVAASGWLVMRPAHARRHDLLRSIPIGLGWWWIAGGSYDSPVVAAFCSACTAATFGLVTLTASGMYASYRGRT